MSQIRIFPHTLLRTAGLPMQVVMQFSAEWQDMERTLSQAQEELQQLENNFQALLDQEMDRIPPSALRSRLYKIRQKFFQKRKIPSQTDLLGLPEVFSAHTAQLLRQRKLVISLEEDYQGQYEYRFYKTFAHLRRWSMRPKVQRALLFASPDLLLQLPKLYKYPIKTWRKKERQIAYSLGHYVLRAATKTSPFSHLTTVSAEPWENPGPAFPFDYQQSLATPNAGLLPPLYAVLLQSEEFCEQLQLVLNPCIVSADQDHYQWLFFDGAQESFQKSEQNPILKALIHFFIEKNRMASYPAVLRWLMEATEAEPDAAKPYLRELVDLGFLAWDLPEKGMSAGWAGRLYQFLGTLPPTPLISETAQLLNWLRTTQRTLAHQPIPDIHDALEAGAAMVQAFFKKYQVPFDLPVAQLFYNDVETVVNSMLPAESLRQVVTELAQYWLAAAVCEDSPLRTALTVFYEKQYENRPSVPFLSFCEDFLANPGKKDTTPQSAQPHRGNMGGLFQFYLENGDWHAVVNALYPGGGKMMARWLHLLSPQLQQDLKQWAADRPAMPFPWQGWHNASFQHQIPGPNVIVPEMRLARPDPGYLLGDLRVQKTPTGIALFADKKPIEWTDLGLEAPASRPPVAQILLQLGLPRVSVAV
ncbi:MAG: lantibiotic dehydratase [Lewinellaceae bacterium]|nr:lantibiotic dehydratase [Lewinellaceae bacterium]